MLCEIRLVIILWLKSVILCASRVSTVHKKIPRIVFFFLRHRHSIRRTQHCSCVIMIVMYTAVMSCRSRNAYDALFAFDTCPVGPYAYTVCHLWTLSGILSSNNVLCNTFVLVRFNHWQPYIMQLLWNLPRQQLHYGCDIRISSLVSAKFELPIFVALKNILTLNTYLFKKIDLGPKRPRGIRTGAI